MIDRKGTYPRSERWIGVGLAAVLALGAAACTSGSHSSASATPTTKPKENCATTMYDYAPIKGGPGKGPTTFKNIGSQCVDVYRDGSYSSIVMYVPAGGEINTTCLDPDSDAFHITTDEGLGYVSVSGSPSEDFVAAQNALPECTVHNT